MKKMMATLAILIAASTITANASSKYDNNGRHNNDNVAMMNNDYDRHNDGDRVYNGGRHHRGDKVVIINNYGRRRDCYMVRHEAPRARFAHHAHPFIGYRISEMPREARRVYRDHCACYVYEGYVFNPVVTAAGIIFEAIAVASTR